jgi:hypothetical protein
MMTIPLWFEAGKLATQLVGAILVTWLAVGWALRRYKAEKTWERRLAAYVDAVSALSEMRLVVGAWIDEIEESRESAPEATARQIQRYRSAHRRLEEGAAAALLLLPRDTTDLLNGLDRKIEKARRGEIEHDDLESEYAVLSDVLKRITELGRADLGPKIQT